MPAGYNPAVRCPQPRKAFLFLVVLISITACSPEISAGTPTSGSIPVLVPYQSPTPTETIPSSIALDSNLPSPTPATYVVVKGDTFFSIAAQLGISLDALMAANPNVDARLLTPGTTLLLPGGASAEATGIPTATPVPVEVGKTKCYSSAAGELWCFIQVKNNLPTSVENLIGVVQLLSEDGNVLATLEAATPLNLLVSGQSMPLVAYLADPPEGWAVDQCQLLSAYPLAEGSDYYLSASIQNAHIDISANGISATATGNVEIQSGEAGTIWVLAVAYDASGEVVGIRRWESEGDANFETIVYSLGPKITKVDLLVEARP